jgi:histone H3/H4
MASLFHHWIRRPLGSPRREGDHPQCGATTQNNIFTKSIRMAHVARYINKYSEQRRVRQMAELSQIEKVIGTPLGARLATRYGGQRKYIAANQSRLGWLIEVIGQQAAIAIWEGWRGCYLRVPRKSRRGRRPTRDRSICWARDCQIFAQSEYLSIAQMSEIYLIDRREIQRILRRLSSNGISKAYFAIASTHNPPGAT